LCRSGIYCLEPGCAEPVELLAWHTLIIVGVQCRHSGNTGPLLTNRGGTAKYNIINQTGIQIVTITKGAQYLGREINRRNFV
jgi:hypothetical protein